MAIVKKMYEPVKKVSELQSILEQEGKIKAAKIIAAYNAKFQKIKP